LPVTLTVVKPEPAACQPWTCQEMRPASYPCGYQHVSSSSYPRRIPFPSLVYACGTTKTCLPCAYVDRCGRLATQIPGSGRSCSTRRWVEPRPPGGRTSGGSWCRRCRWRCSGACGGGRGPTGPLGWIHGSMSAKRASQHRLYPRIRMLESGIQEHMAVAFPLRTDLVHAISPPHRSRIARAIGASASTADTSMHTPRLRLSMVNRRVHVLDSAGFRAHCHLRAKQAARSAVTHSCYRHKQSPQERYKHALIDACC
jgi:hypothetical protein